MANKKSRIGFILGSIHTGSASPMWKTLVKEASHTDSAFFVFPGGKLNAVKDSEYLRNSIYRLANTENLDGLISWGSSIGGEITVDELNAFHNNLSPLPYVTIAHKMPGHGCVKFDAYNGMASLVRHFVHEHGAYRIAFLRGPSNHSSSVERFRAFCDVMMSCGYDMRRSKLVSDPFAWGEGEEAIKQLYQERGLIPGRDFDVLIGASDLMTFSAVKFLQRAGFSVPDDFTCAGFNDSVESRIMGSAFSTVHMPYDALELSALKMIKDLLAGETEPKDLVLSADVVIRESCGCSVANSLATNDAVSVPVSHTPAQLKNALAKLFRLDEISTNAIIEPIVNGLQSDDEAMLFSLVDKSLERFFSQDMDLRLLFKGFALAKAADFLPVGFCASLENRFLLAVSLAQNRILQAAKYNERRLQAELNSLKCQLLAARSRINLLEMLHEHLPRIGIHSAALVLTGAYSKSEKESVFAGGFTPENCFFEGEVFDAKKLLPESVSGFESGVFLVQPLFMEKQPIGYFVCNVPAYEGTLFEELRSIISSSLTGVFLFEETSVARERAEKAEMSKTDFFANMGSDLCEPLMQLGRKIDQIQSMVLSGCTDQDILSSEMVFIKNSIEEQVEKTNLVLDLTLSQKNELPFEKYLFQVGTVVGNSAPPGSYPLIYGDPERLLQALEIFAKISGRDLEDVVLKEIDSGLLFLFEADKTMSEDLWQRNDVLLAERICMLLGAGIEKNSDSIRITYPWPKFSCKAAAASAELYQWNADSAPEEDWGRIYANRATEPFASSAFLCRTAMATSELKKIKNFTSLFEKKMTSGVSNPILFIGKSFTENFSWAPYNQSIFINSMESFEETLEKITPSMVVFDFLDAEAVEKVRCTPSTVMCPVLVLGEHVKDEEQVSKLIRVPRVILCNTSIAKSPEFARRAMALLAGEEILPPDTGALVKKAICYLNANSGTQISRWKLADYVHVSEDYLTRIFHKETGLSPWEYLNRYRIYLASQMLLHTNATVFEVSEKCGFQDQAYFCRVFKKIHGVPPGKFRSATVKN